MALVRLTSVDPGSPVQIGQIGTVCYQLLACPAAGSGAGKEKRVIKEGSKLEKEISKRIIRRSILISFIDVVPLVIGFLKFWYAVVLIEFGNVSLKLHGWVFIFDKPSMNMVVHL